MSRNTFVEETQIFGNSKEEKENLFQIPKKNLIYFQKLMLFPSEYKTFLPFNKNGSREEIKSGTNYLKQNINKGHENLFNFNELNINYINYQKFFRIPPKNDNFPRLNSLEPKTSNSKELETKSSKPNSEGKKNNENLYNEVFQKFPLISSAFNQKNIIVNNNIYQSPKKIFIITNPSKPDKPSLIKSPKTIKTSFNNKIKMQKYENNKNQIKNKNKNKDIFIIPHDFLKDFNIKEINIKSIEINQPNYCANLNDLNEAKTFINNLCQTNINNKDNLNDMNISKGEYIESKNTLLLQRKRKASLYGKPKKVKRNKNKNKKKMTAKLKKQQRENNRKDGKSICANLNQIKINDNTLDIFPFYPMNIENIKIEFLEGLIKEEHIKINPKNELINDKRNLKYINNKSFEIIYQYKEEESIQYILHINNEHIFNLFLYYYYQIKRNILLLNQRFYSHGSKAEIEEIKGGLQNLIEKSNKLTKEIVKSNV